MMNKGERTELKEENKELKEKWEEQVLFLQKEVVEQIV